MKNNVTNISIIIPTMNRVDSLTETLKNLVNSSVLPSEILVIDQSTDGNIIKKIKEVIEGCQLNIEYYHQNPSLTGARNFGLSKAQNDVLIFMDDDVNVEYKTIENIANIMLDSSVSMIAGYDLNAGEEKSKLGYIFGKKSYRNRNIGYVTDSIFGRLPHISPNQVDTQWAMGYFFVVRKSLVINWDIKWDEKFISYGYPEDLDFSYRYCLKSKANGYRCILDPGVKVRHMVSQEWRETSRMVTFMYVINREYLTYKWGLGVKSRIKTRWVNFGTFLYRLVKNDNCTDVIKAQYYCDKYRKDIKNGNLHTELYYK